MGSPTSPGSSDGNLGRWTWKFLVAVLAFLLLETAAGSAVCFAPFHASVQGEFTALVKRGTGRHSLSSSALLQCSFRPDSWISTQDVL